MDAFSHTGGRVWASTLTEIQQRLTTLRVRASFAYRPFARDCSNYNVALQTIPASHLSYSLYEVTGDP